MRLQVLEMSFKREREREREKKEKKEESRKRFCVKNLYSRESRTIIEVINNVPKTGNETEKNTLFDKQNVFLSSFSLPSPLLVLVFPLLASSFSLKFY